MTVKYNICESYEKKNLRTTELDHVHRVRRYRKGQNFADHSVNTYIVINAHATNYIQFQQYIIYCSIYLARQAFIIIYIGYNIGS